MSFSFVFGFILKPFAMFVGQEEEEEEERERRKEKKLKLFPHARGGKHLKDTALMMLLKGFTLYSNYL